MSASRGGSRGAGARHTGSVRRKWWSSGSTRKYLKMELDQNRSMWSCWCVSQPLLTIHGSVSSYPVLYLSVADGVVQTVSCLGQNSPSTVSSTV
jgi:hypothetical protein